MCTSWFSALYRYGAFLLLVILNSNYLTGQQARYPEKNLSQHPANDRYASYSPDGKHILFESDRNGNWDIFIMDRSGAHVRALTRDSAADRRPSWYPDGAAILFESDRDGRNDFYNYSLQENRVKKAMEGAVPEGLRQFGRIAPNGQNLVFTLQVNDSVFHQYLYNIDRKTIEKLSAGNFRFAYANWSPNGKVLALHARHETENQYDEIYSLCLKNNRWKRLTQTPKHSFCPAWSRSGKQIAYVQSMAGTRPEIFIMTKKGKKHRRITDNSDGDTLPSWSPNDQQLLITGYRDGNFEICEIQLF